MLTKVCPPVLQAESVLVPTMNKLIVAGTAYTDPVTFHLRTQTLQFGYELVTDVLIALYKATGQLSHHISVNVDGTHNDLLFL